MKRSIVIITILSVFLSFPMLWADDSRPRALKAISGDGVIYLSWSPSKSEVTGYLVYRALPDGDYQQLNPYPIEKTFYKDTDVINGQSYWYTVTAIDIYGNKGPQSKDILVTPNVSTGPLGGY